METSFKKEWKRTQVIMVLLGIIYIVVQLFWNLYIRPLHFTRSFNQKRTVQCSIEEIIQGYN